MYKPIILERKKMNDPIAYDNERLETMEWFHKFSHEQTSFEFEDGKVARMILEVE